MASNEAGKPRGVPPNALEATYAHLESSVATGSQTFTITLPKGKVQAIKAVSIYVAAAGIAAKFGIANGNPGTKHEHGDFYLYTQTGVTYDDLVFRDGNVRVTCDHQVGAAADVYVTVRYLYR